MAVAGELAAPLPVCFCSSGDGTGWDAARSPAMMVDVQGAVWAHQLVRVTPGVGSATARAATYAGMGKEQVNGEGQFQLLFSRASTGKVKQCVCNAA